MIDFVAQALSRLTNQFSESPKVRGFIEAMVLPIARIGADADALKTERWIATAVGKQLDGCGYIVGELRQGRDDDAYRDAILFKVFVNTSKGTPADMIQGLRILTSPSDIQYIEQYPATAMFFTNGANPPTGLQATMQDLAPAAIADVPVMVSYARAEPFRFSKAAPDNLLNVGSGTRLTANGDRLSVTAGEATDGASTLAGLAPAYMLANGAKLTAGAGRLRITSPNHMTVIEPGYHLPGIYQ